jgi:DHA3 family tetracycline resistance protein-like MFS transporter
MRLLAPLRRADFARLFAGGAVSLAGDGIYLVAIAFQVLALTNTPTALSLVLLAWSAGLVACLPAAGVLVDRVARKPVLIAADGVQLVATAALGVLSVTGVLTVWHCAATAALVGAGAAFVKPAAAAILPSVVPGDEVVAATALQQSADRAATLFIGPAIGGMLVAGLGTGEAFLADAATFAFSMACVAFIRSPTAPPARERQSVVREARAGLEYVCGEPWLWATLVAAAVAVMAAVGPLDVLLPYVVKNEWGQDADTYGLLMATSGAAGLVISLVVGQRGLPRRAIAWMFVVWGVGTAAIAGYGIAGSFAAAVPFAIVLGLGFAGEVIWFSLVRLRVPAELLGRVSSIDWLVSLGLLPLSFGLCGPIAEAVGAQATLVGAGLVGGGVFVVMWLAVPRLRGDGARDGDGERAPVASRPDLAAAGDASDEDALLRTGR